MPNILGQGDFAANEVPMEVYTEDYVEGIYNEHISIIKQNIPFIDLPTKDDDEITSYKFFLQLSSVEPVNFTMILTTEY